MKIRLQPIVPKASYNAADFERAANKALERTNALIQRDFQDTVRTWEKKPVFRIVARRTSTDLGADVTTDNVIYGYVTYGTKPHIIRPRNGPLLRFRGPSTPKTRPGIIRSGQGSIGNVWASAAVVQHPGTEPRKFHEVIAKRRQKTFEQMMRDEMAKAARGKG